MSTKKCVSISALIFGTAIYFIFDSGPVRNHLPDFLWALSFYLSLTFYTSSSFYALTIVVMCGLSLELCQHIHLINGTADILDVTAEALGALLAYLGVIK